MNWLYLWIAFCVGQLSGLGIVYLGIWLGENFKYIPESEKSIFEKKQAD